MAVGGAPDASGKGTAVLAATARRLGFPGFGEGTTFALDLAGRAAGAAVTFLRLAACGNAATLAFVIETFVLGDFPSAAARNSLKLARKSPSKRSMSGTA